MSAAAEASAPWDLLARQLAGEATPADEAAVRAWRDESAANTALWQQLTGVWREAGAAAIVFTPADAAQAWQRFEATVLGPPPAAPTQPASPPPASPAAPAGFLVGAGKTAALLIAGVGAGWLLRTAVPPAADAPATAAAPAPTEVTRTAPASRPLPAAVDLVFENEPLSAVAQRLEAAFPGTRVEVGDPELAQQRFTGTFRAARPAAVLRVVSITTGATLESRAPDSSVWRLVRPTR